MHGSPVQAHMQHAIVVMHLLLECHITLSLYWPALLSGKWIDNPNVALYASNSNPGPNDDNVITLTILSDPVYNSGAAPAEGVSGAQMIRQLLSLSSSTACSLGLTPWATSHAHVTVDVPHLVTQGQLAPIAA